MNARNMGNAAMHVGTAGTMSVGRILPKFVTPYDVRDLKNRVDPFVRAVDQGAAECTTIPAAHCTSGSTTRW